MNRKRISISRPVAAVYWIVAGLLVVGGLLLVGFVAPVEAQMGAVQKIFYFHLPVAMTTFVACAVVAFASGMYLWQRAAVWDDLAHAAAEVAVLYCSVVLVTGMVWAREAWGHWWTWSPRLTLSLVLWLLYVVYVVVRPTIEPAARRAVVCAVYGVLAFLDVPLVYFSVKLMPDDIHPARVVLPREMVWTMLYWGAPVLMLCVGFIWARFGLRRRARAAGGEA